MTETTTPPWLPLHENLPELIRMATPAGLEWAGALMRTTKIPANHDAIIEAWQEAFYGAEEEHREKLKYEETLAALERQKTIAEAEAQAAAEKEEFVESDAADLDAGDEFLREGVRHMMVYGKPMEVDRLTGRAAVALNGSKKGEVAEFWGKVQKIVRKGN